MNVFLDCETAPTDLDWYRDEIEIAPPGNYKKPESIQKWLDENAETERRKLIDKTAVDTSLARIICICYAIEDGPVIELTGDEKDILQAFKTALINETGDRKTMLIGHNILAFDIPLIFHRNIINGIKPHQAFHMHYRPWEGRCYDTMVEWSGIRDRISQHNLARLLGIETQDADGAQVLQLYADGKIDEVARKCRFDVQQNRQIYQRMKSGGDAK